MSANFSRDVQVMSGPIAMNLMQVCGRYEPVDSLCALARALSYMIVNVAGEGLVSEEMILRLQPEVQKKVYEHVLALCDDTRKKACQ